MDDVFFHLAPKVHFGEGVSQRAGRELLALGVHKVLVVTDPGVIKAGVATRILGELEEAGISFELFSELSTNPTDVQVMAAVERCRTGRVDGVVGLGGGSAMDIAKSAAIVRSGGGHIRDYEDGKKPAPETYLPLMFIPTTAGTGAEMVGGTIITDTERRFKMHIVAAPGQVVLLDPLLTLTLPPEMTAATGLDALAHAIGAYVSVECQPFTDAYALYAIELVHRYLLRAIENGQDREARGGMMLASAAAGISMKGGGSAEHALAHAINVQHGVHHGVGCAVFLADVMAFNMPHRVERYARIGRALGVDQRLSPDLQAKEAIAAVRKLVSEAGIPTLRDLGVDESNMAQLVAYVMSDEFHLGLNPVPISPSDAEALFLTSLGH
ncbi:MAG: iron-containing alcohol dehydrogenase [Geminicoccaceae bacterium]